MMLLLIIHVQGAGNAIVYTCKHSLIPEVLFLALNTTFFSVSKSPHVMVFAFKLRLKNKVSLPKSNFSTCWVTQEETWTLVLDIHVTLGTIVYFPGPPPLFIIIYFCIRCRSI